MPSAYPFPSFPPRNTSAEGLKRGCEADAHPLPPFLPRIFFPSRARGWEMTKELRRGTVARRMGAHTFHGCFRDKRYAGRLDTREYELREEQSAFPGSLVLQLHANPFAYVVQTTTMSRAPVSPFLPSPPFPLLLSRAYTLGYLRIRYGACAAISTPAMHFLRSFET